MIPREGTSGRQRRANVGSRTTVGNTPRMIYTAVPWVTIPPSRLRPQARPERPDLSGWEVGQPLKRSPSTESNGVAMERSGIALSRSAWSPLYAYASGGVNLGENS